MDYNLLDLLDNLHDGLYLVDRDRRITRWNRAAERITGYTAAEVIGEKCSDNMLEHVDDVGTNLCIADCPLSQAMSCGESREAQVYLRHRLGHRLPVWVRGTPLRNDLGEIVGAAELFTDMSQIEASRQRIEELETMAMLDPLTNLANRRFLETSIEARMAERDRFGVIFGLLFMDIDHFKRFNDDYGHHVGDMALQTVARTLSASARPFDLFGRWGGEEFVGIIRNVNRASFGAIAERFRSLVDGSGIAIKGHKLRVTVSVGAVLVRPGESTEELVARADRLMYESKANGRNRVTFD